MRESRIVSDRTNWYGAAVHPVPLVCPICRGRLLPLLPCCARLPHSFPLLAAAGERKARQVPLEAGAGEDTGAPHAPPLSPRPCSLSGTHRPPVSLCLQVCDEEWHHYALNLAFPTVTLYVDGVSYDPALIHDNGLIHPPRRESSLTIGACWAGEQIGADCSLLGKHRNGPFRIFGNGRGVQRGQGLPIF